MDLSHSPTGWLIVGLLLVTPWANAADVQAESVAATPSTKCEGDHELWLISTRHLCFPNWSDPSTYDFDVRRYDPSAGWQESSFNEFLAGPSRFTVVYVHANRSSWSDAIQQGHMVYNSLASCSNSIPMRFVIWSWPSDRIRGALQDIRVKADRADVEGSFFGWFLSRLKPGTSVGLAGFSYGARIISGGLQLLSGGMINGHALPESQPGEPLRIRAVYLAAAVDVNWLYPWGYHGQSLSQIERLLIAYDACDPALKRFHFTDPCTRPTALGYTGIHSGSLGEASGRVEQLDVSNLVGRTHDEIQYWCSTYIMSEICRVVFEGVTPSADAGTADPMPVPQPVVQPVSAELATSNDETISQDTSEVDGRRFQRSGRLFGRRR